MKQYDTVLFEMIPVPILLNSIQPYLKASETDHGALISIYHIHLWKCTAHPTSVLASVLKMPIQNNNPKISAHPDFATCTATSNLYIN